MAFLSDSKKAQKDIERRKCFRIVSGNNKEQMTDAKLQGTWTVKSVDVKLYDNGKEIQVPAELQELFEEIGSEDTIETLSKGATLKPFAPEFFCASTATIPTRWLPAVWKRYRTRRGLRRALYG